MKKVIAIMPIKLKNERLPGKNTMILGGKPLLCHELDTLKRVTGINEIYVSRNNKICTKKERRNSRSFEKNNFEIIFLRHRAFV